MKIIFLNLKKNFRKKDYEVNPRKIWTGVLLLSAVIVFFSILYGWSSFNEISKAFNPQGLPKIDQAEKERKMRLEKILKDFSEREQKSQIIIDSPSPVVDPSS